MVKRLFVICAAALVVALSTTGCSKSVEQRLLGSWVERVSMGDQSVYQGFTLKNDSICSSINTATLQYIKWSCDPQDNTIVMHGRSIGNGMTLDFIDTLTIEQLSKDSLIVNRGGQTIRYSRVQTEKLTELLGRRINPIDSLTLNPLMGGLMEKIYNGVIPAADCPGIDCTINLWSQSGATKEGVYSLSMRYIEAENGKDVTDTTYGRYYTLLGLTEVYGEEILQLIEFNKPQQPTNCYIYPDGDSVLWLGSGYQRIDSSLNYNLRLLKDNTSDK